MGFIDSAIERELERQEMGRQVQEIANELAAVRSSEMVDRLVEKIWKARARGDSSEVLARVLRLGYGDAFRQALSIIQADDLRGRKE